MPEPEGSDQNREAGAGVPDDKVAGVGTGGPTQAEMSIGPQDAEQPTVPGVPQALHDEVLAENAHLKSDLEAVTAERDTLQDQLDEVHAVYGDAADAVEEQPAEGSTAAEGLPDNTPSDELKQQWADQGYVGDPPEEG